MVRAPQADRMGPTAAKPRTCCTACLAACGWRRAAESKARSAPATLPRSSQVMMRGSLGTSPACRSTSAVMPNTPRDSTRIPGCPPCSAAHWRRAVRLDTMSGLLWWSWTLVWSPSSLLLCHSSSGYPLAASNLMGDLEAGDPARWARGRSPGRRRGRRSRRFLEPQRCSGSRADRRWWSARLVGPAAR